MGSRKCLVVGCGYLGQRVARRWRDQGWDVCVTTRSAIRAEHFRQEGYRPLVLDVTDRQFTLPQADVVLVAVGYDRQAVPSQRDVYVAGLRAILDRCPSPPQSVVYISSTGVYGQTDGSWVDEDSPCEPTREGGKICLEAEQLLQSHELGPRSVILRLAGIYGPGRVPYLQRLRAEEPLAVPRTGYLNLIHVEDAAEVVLAAVELGTPPDVYVVSDGHPVIRQRFYEEIGRRLDLPVQFCDPETDDDRAQRAMASKRIDNRRMRERLRVALKYPNYVEGLRAILKSDLPGRDP